jgi:thiamine-phosphate pyrophosphorylase
MNSSKIAKLQFISPPQLAGVALYEQTRLLLEAGLTWVQFRRKLKTEDLTTEVKNGLIKEAFELKELCQKHHASFIINDHLWLCQKIDADGVHLGRKDGSLMEARQLLGPNKIIGTSSNSLSDLQEAFHHGVDYSGLGPIYPTTTKKDHNPVLGWENTIKIITNFKQDLPVVLIGGISERDLPLHSSLENCRIALSSALADANALTNFKTYLNKF